MLNAPAVQFETLQPEVLHYIRGLETDILQLKEYQNKYLALKEQYDLLVYQKFARSAEQLRADDKQQPLFAEEPEQAAPPEPESEKQEIKSYTRNKPGRKPPDPNLPRVEEIIDIPEGEKPAPAGRK
jgi:transposase